MIRVEGISGSISCGSVGRLFMFSIFNFIQVINGTRIASAGHSVLADSGQNHSLSQTLLKTTILTTISLLFRNNALAVSDTRVNSIQINLIFILLINKDLILINIPFVLNRSFEESFTALARNDSVMKSSRSVLTYHTNHLRIG